MPTTTADAPATPGLAAPPKAGSGAAPAQLHQGVAFVLGGEEFALPIMCVHQIDGPLTVVPLPRCPAFLRGTAQVRGQSIPVIELGLRLGLTAPRQRHGGRTLIVASAGRTLALAVDRVSEIICLDAGALSPATTLRRGINHACVQGILRTKGRSLVLLDPERLLDAADLELLPAIS